MQKQGNGYSVVHNKPEYADVQRYDGHFTDFVHESYHIYKTALIAKNK